MVHKELLIDRVDTITVIIRAEKRNPIVTGPIHLLSNVYLTKNRIDPW